LLQEGEPKLPADILGGMVGWVDYRKQFARERLTGAGKKSSTRLGRVTKTSRLRHQPEPPLQLFLTLEGEVIDARIADDYA
jgi:hypothetical protein